MTPKTIAILCFNDVVGLDITGPAEAFASVQNFAVTSEAAPYRIELVGLDMNPVVSESGVTFQPNRSLATLEVADTLIVPGGRGLREATVNKVVTDWLRLNSERFRRVASVCTGIYGLAPSGLLDGRRVTTHWRFAADVKGKFAELDVDVDAIFIKAGKFYTSAGATAGIDLALALIEEDCGPRVSLSVARELVVYVKRQGGHRQFSDPMQFQMKNPDKFSDLVASLTTEFSKGINVEGMAAKVALSPRQFSRTFKSRFDCTPAAFVEKLRLNEACLRLASADATIEQVADSVGFKSADVFRRAFERQFGVRPSEYGGRSPSVRR